MMENNNEKKEYMLNVEVAAEQVQQPASAGGEAERQMWDIELPETEEPAEHTAAPAAADTAADDPAEEIAAAVRQQREQQQNREARRAAIRRKKIMRRRMAALGVIGLVVLILLGSLLGGIIRRAMRPKTQNLGPLPSDTVSVERLPQYYDYAQPVPTSPAVSDSWFGDALLIGDSRVQCLDLYGVNPFETLLYGSAIDVGNAWNYDCKEAGSDTSRSLYDKLGLQRYGKIYISLGVKELGWSNTDKFAADYRELVEAVMACQPEASVYLVAIFPVSAAKDGKVSYITNTRIAEYNALIRQIAEEMEVYYLDAYTAMGTDGGALASAHTSDGVNLVKDGCIAWTEFFKTHTVNPEEYVN